MSGDIELVSDGEGLAVVGDTDSVERFMQDSGLEKASPRKLDLHKVWAVTGTAAAGMQIGADVAANSGRWIKLTAESAAAVRKFGLMPTKTPGVSHAMIGKPGQINQWIQVAKAPTMLSLPVALTQLSKIMQQQAMQRQLDLIDARLDLIDEKIDDILRRQKNAVLADVIGIDMVIDDAMAVRDEVGRVSDVTWSKVQAASQTLARTQAYALLELESVAQGLSKKADLGEIAKATHDAKRQVHEWLAVLAYTVQLQEGISVLELDRVLGSPPEELENHRLGLIKARQRRLDRIGRCTTELLTQMDQTVRTANTRVLLNPFDSPAAVKASNEVAAEVLSFRDLLDIGTGTDLMGARVWRRAAGEAVQKALTGTGQGAAAAKRYGGQTVQRAADVFREVDIDGDGIPDKPRAAAATDQARDAFRGAASGLTGAARTLFQHRKSPVTDADASDPGDEDS